MLYRGQCQDSQLPCVREAGRKSDRRIKEGMLDVARMGHATGKMLEHVDHCLTTGDTLDFTNVTTQAREERWRLESWFVCAEPNLVN